MDSLNREEVANLTRLTKLLVDKGAQALRNTFNDIHPPAKLSAVLDANRKYLSKLKVSHIGDQLDSLFPSSGTPPDSKTFDVRLLTFLLHNICDLPPPATGWDAMPPDSDRSTEANIARIKQLRNQVYPLAMSARVDNAAFEKLWKEVSQALVELKIPRKEIDVLKTCPLGPEEKIYVQMLIDWDFFENNQMGFLALIKPYAQHLQGDRHDPSRAKLEPKSKKPKKDSSSSWEWRRTSQKHREKFEKLLEYVRHSPQKITEINDVRVCFKKEFLIKRGSDGTSVFVGLSKDGGERAVKRLVRSISGPVAEQEMEILNERNAIKSNHVVKYRFLDKSNEDWLYLIMDLCEETLEDFVQRSSRDELLKIGQHIIQQILRGLADIHHDPRSILHRDLKPSNIMRDVDGNWLLADFGISRILTPEESTCLTKQKGTDHWRAVEWCLNYASGSVEVEVRYKKESDVQVAGMMAFYVLTKGKHPFGEEPDQLRNVLDGKPVYLNMVEDPPANDLISWMLSHEPKDRPLAEEALKHPYLASPEQQFKMLCEVANQREIKKGDVDSDVVQKLNTISGDWQKQIDSKVLNYLRIDFVTGKPHKYRPSWCECLRLIRNVNQHWYDISRQRPQLDEEFYLVDIPQKYFLDVFPNLPTDVHRIVRSSDWKERPNIKEYFSSVSSVDSLDSVDMNISQKEMDDLKTFSSMVPKEVPTRDVIQGESFDQVSVPTGESAILHPKTSSSSIRSPTVVEDTFLEDTFLTSEYSIKDDIREKLTGFPWLNGPYGVTGPNRYNRRLHIFVTVKEGYKKSKVLEDLKRVFGVDDARKYFEFQRESKVRPKFKYRLGATSGKNFVAVTEIREIDGQNPLQAKANSIYQNENKERKCWGTLTMFCYKNGVHLALTCFHTAINPEQNDFDEAFNCQGEISPTEEALNHDEQDFDEAISCENEMFPSEEATDPKKQDFDEPIDFQNEMSSTEEALNQDFEEAFYRQREMFPTEYSLAGFKEFSRKKQKFYYSPKSANVKETQEATNDMISLGEISECCFDNKSDIMSIKVKVPIGTEIACKMQEIDPPDWSKISNELRRRIKDRGDSIRVAKGGYPMEPEHTGKIIHHEYSYICNGKTLFQDALLVRGDSKSFLSGGDSGAPIYFFDQNGKMQPYAYGVSEVDGIQQEQLSSDEESDDYHSTDGSFALDDDADNIHQEQVSSDENADNGGTFQDDAGKYDMENEVISDEKTDDVGSTDGSVTFDDDAGDRAHAICFKLKTALENLELSQHGWFQHCNKPKHKTNSQRS